MYVNLNDIRPHCQHCKHLNYSRKTVNQILDQVKKLHLKDNEEIGAVMLIECDNCQKNFEINCFIEKYKSIYFVKERGMLNGFVL